MAATVEAKRLTEAHRLAQARLGAQTVAQLIQVWPLLDISDIDGTVEQWLGVAVPLVQRQRSISARLAANYLTTFRALELGLDAGTVVPLVADTVEPERVATSLIVTGPARIRSAFKGGVAFQRVTGTAKAESAAAAMRHVLNGGRETITGTVYEDRRALGWARSTSGKTCSFCAMLAARGPAYKNEGTADFQAHDHCSCSVEPVYRRDAAWPAGSDRFASLWRQAEDADGDTTTNFRRLVTDAA